MKSFRGLFNNSRLATVILRIVIVAVFILFVLEAFKIFLPGLEPLLKNGNEEEIIAYLSETGGMTGMISVVLLQIMQVISVVIPGLAIQIAAGIIYGWLKAFILCYIGFVAANTGVFIFARKTHRSAGASEFKNERVRWIVEQLKDTNPGMAIFLGYLVPGIPNGILPYLAAGTKITTPKFLLSVAASSWIQILCNCIAGGFIIQGRYGFFVLTIILQILLIVIILFNYKRFFGEFRKKDQGDKT
jgi:uncharacterized membrane protein YdjX (TVP38/TMEM64 family)